MKKEKFKKAEGGYDFESDIFFAVPDKRNYDSSFQVGNFIFDLDRKGKINGIEILNASEIFRMPKNFLSKMISGKIEVSANEKFIKVLISIKSLVRNADKISTINLERLRPELIAPTELKLTVAS